jgi:hypothetical protein
MQIGTKEKAVQQCPSIPLEHSKSSTAFFVQDIMERQKGKYFEASHAESKARVWKKRRRGE